MRPLLTTSVFRPLRLEADARDALSRRLFAVHGRLFDGVDLDAFRRTVVEPPAHDVRIRVFLDRDGEDVGYLTFQVFHLPGGLRPRVVIRTQAGLLPEYRRYNASFRYLFRECVLHFVSRGFPETYFLATPVHPVPYALACRHLAQVYPRPERPMPARFRAVLAQLNRDLHLGAPVDGRPFARRVGWIVRSSERHRRLLASSPDPWVRFYLRHNPGYANGDGMLVIAPFNLQNGWYGAWNLVRRRVRTTRRALAAWRRPLRGLRAVLGER